MKTIIVYASHYGYTEELVNKMIKESNDTFDSFNIVSNHSLDLKQYDNVILGSCIYIGLIDKEMKKFIHNNQALLLEKNLGIFLACAFEDQFESHLLNNFPIELINHSMFTLNLGGKLQKDKLSLAHKLLVGMIEKTEKGKKPIKSFDKRTQEIVNRFYSA